MSAMLKPQRRHKHDLKAAMRGYVLLAFAIASFLLIGEIAIFLIRLVVG